MHTKMKITATETMMANVARERMRTAIAQHAHSNY